MDNFLSADSTYDALRDVEIDSIAYLTCALGIDYPAWYGPSDAEALTLYTYFGTGQLNTNLSLDIQQRLGWADKRTLTISSVNTKSDGLYECSAPHTAAHRIRLVVWGKLHYAGFFQLCVSFSQT